MTMAKPDMRFQLDDFARTHLAEHGDGWRLALHWLATTPEKAEVSRVAKIARDLHNGGISGCDTYYYDATHFPSFLAFLKDTPHEREIYDGVEEMHEINKRQGTNYPAWPKQAFAVSFDSAFVLGFAAACLAAVGMR